MGAESAPPPPTRSPVPEDQKQPRLNQPRPQGLLAFQYGGGRAWHTADHVISNEDGDVFKMAAKATRSTRSGYEITAEAK